MARWLDFRKLRRFFFINFNTCQYQGCYLKLFSWLNLFINLPRPNWFYRISVWKCTHCLHFDTSSRIRPGYIEIKWNYLFSTFTCILYTQTVNMFFKMNHFYLFLQPHLKRYKQVLSIFNTKKLKTLLFIRCIFRKPFAFLSNFSWNIPF